MHQYMSKQYANQTNGSAPIRAFKSMICRRRDWDRNDKRCSPNVFADEK
jgi:hypothetical protein